MTSAADRYNRIAARADAAVERMDIEFRREARRLGLSEGSHEWNMARIEYGWRRFVESMEGIRLNIQRNTERLDDMGDAMRANTRAVLSALDRLGPATG